MNTKHNSAYYFAVFRIQKGHQQIFGWASKNKHNGQNKVTKYFRYFRHFYKSSYNNNKLNLLFFCFKDTHVLSFLSYCVTAHMEI